jgi:hypothetical protein
MKADRPTWEVSSNTESNRPATDALEPVAGRSLGEGQGNKRAGRPRRGTHEYKPDRPDSEQAQGGLLGRCHQINPNARGLTIRMGSQKL